MFHYLAELEAHRTELKDDSDHAKLKHLTLLVDYIRTAYASTTSRLALYLKNREISYDLLWALFKPNTAVYTTMFDAENPACFKYESGKERINSNDVAYFHVECHYLDYNGKAFGEVSTALGIRMFQGAKRIDSLEAFPLEFHRHYKDIRMYLLKCGRRFVSLMGEHHVQYLGDAACLEQGEYIEVPVDSRIILAILTFQISTGELGLEAKALEDQLSRILALPIIGRRLSFSMKPMYSCRHALSTTRIMILSRSFCVNLNTTEELCFLQPIV